MCVVGVEIRSSCLSSELCHLSYLLSLVLCIIHSFSLDVPQEAKQSPYPSKHICRWRGQLKP